MHNAGEIKKELLDPKLAQRMSLCTVRPGGMILVNLIRVLNANNMWTALDFMEPVLVCIMNDYLSFLSQPCSICMLLWAESYTLPKPLSRAS